MQPAVRGALPAAMPKPVSTTTYQFAATGLLLENSNRERKHHIQSTSLLKEEMMIFGVDSRRPSRNPFPLLLILKPFTAGAWAGFLVSLFAVAFSGILADYTVGPRPFCRRSLLIFVVHGYSDNNITCTAPRLTEGRRRMNS